MESNLDRTIAYELLYDDSAVPVIVKKWKQTEVESARDDIHTNRVSLTIPGVTYRELYALGIQEGFIRSLFSFEMALAMGMDEEWCRFCKEEIEKLHNK